MSDVVYPGETPASMTDRITAVALRDQAFGWWWAGFLPALGLLGLMGVSIAWLFWRGVQVWGNAWPAVWGFDIINYVWWIGIASGGTFISSLFFLLRVEWRTSLSRIAESMTLFSAFCAGVYPIVHLGRPWLFYWLFPYPNTMALWPQFRSPLMWDFVAIITYVLASVMFWYLGLLPDLASLRDRARTRRAQLAYGIFALGFRGSGRQWRHYRAVYSTLAAVMAPLVISVHSIVGMDFAGSGAPGWHSTQYPPFFVFGAVLSGFGAVLLLVLPLRVLTGLQPYVTARHVDVLGKLLLTSSLFVAYAYAMDAFGVYYGADEAEVVQFRERLFGQYGGVYWATLVLNCLLPNLLWFRTLRMFTPLLWLVALGAVVGMWLERYGIVVAVEHRQLLPSSWGNFHATAWDWALFAGTIGLFFTGFLLVVRTLPLLALSEMRELLGRGR